MADPKTSPVPTVPPPQAPYQPQGPPIQPQGPPTNQPNSQPAPIGFNVPGGNSHLNSEIWMNVKEKYL